MATQNRTATQAPQFHDNELDQPWSQLMPGELVREGDMQKAIGSVEAWRSVDEALIGKPSPAFSIAIARLSVPEGYRIVLDAEPVEERDLIWATSKQQWVPVSGRWRGSTPLTVRNNVGQTWLCRPTFALSNIREIPIPPRHRQLHVNELVRRGDKLIHLGKAGWEAVGENLRGVPVAECTEQNGWVRYARPIAADFKTWYVDRATGKADSFGDHEAPFDSLDSAERAIQAAGQLIKKPMFGLIISSVGEPLLAYDLPEPPISMEKRGAPSPPITLDPIEIRKPQTMPVYEPQTISWIAQQLGRSGAVIAETADANMPTGTRRVAPDEEIRQGDRLWSLFETMGRPMGWALMPQHLIQAEVNDYFVIRETPPVPPAAKAECKTGQCPPKKGRATQPGASQQDEALKRIARLETMMLRICQRLGIK